MKIGESLNPPKKRKRKPKKKVVKKRVYKRNSSSIVPKEILAPTPFTKKRQSAIEADNPKLKKEDLDFHRLIASPVEIPLFWAWLKANELSCDPLSFSRRCLFHKDTKGNIIASFILPKVYYAFSNRKEIFVVDLNLQKVAEAMKGSKWVYRKSLYEITDFDAATNKVVVKGEDNELLNYSAYLFFTRAVFDETANLHNPNIQWAEYKTNRIYK